MAYEKYVPEFTDKNGNVYGVMDAEVREEVSNLKSAITQLNDNVITESAGPAPIVSIKDGADGMPLRSLSVAVEPVQDLHGYDHPWPGGSGKNLLPMTVEGIKAANTEGTWSGNTYSYRGVSFTILTDSSNNVIGISASGQANTQVRIRAYVGELPSGSYIVSGVPSGGGWSSYWIDVRDNTNATDYNDIGSGRTFTVDTAIDSIVSCYIANNYTVSNVVFAPMLRLASESDATFEPYSNICPISGWTSAKVTRCGKNLLKYPYEWNQTVNNGITYIVNTDGTMVCNGTAGSGNSYGNLVTWKTLEYARLEKFKGRPLKLINLSGNANVRLSLYARDASGTDVLMAWAENSVRSITIPDEAVTVYIAIRVLAGTQLDNFVISPMIVFDEETDYSFVPYTANIYDITFPSESGTVYGGTLDVTSGKLVVDRAKKVLSGAAFYSQGFGATSFGDALAVPSAWNVKNPHLLSNRLIPAGQNVVNNKQIKNTVAISSDGKQVQYYIAGLTSGAEYAQYLAENETYITYKLVAPIEYTLTPQEIKTLLGINNVWADTGDTTVEYPADTKLYIDSKIAELQALILENNG